MATVSYTTPWDTIGCCDGVRVVWRLWGAGGASSRAWGSFACGRRSGRRWRCGRSLWTICLRRIAWCGGSSRSWVCRRCTGRSRRSRAGRVVRRLTRGSWWRCCCHGGGYRWHPARQAGGACSWHRLGLARRRNGCTGRGPHPHPVLRHPVQPHHPRLQQGGQAVHQQALQQRAVADPEVRQRLLVHADEESPAGAGRRRAANAASVKLWRSPRRCTPSRRRGRRPPMPRPES
jgi:hypothetical protein